MTIFLGLSVFVACLPRWDTADAEIKSSSAESPELSEFSICKTGLCWNIAIHTSPSARNSTFLISALLVHAALFSRSSSYIVMFSPWKVYYLWFDDFCFTSIWLSAVDRALNIQNRCLSVVNLPVSVSSRMKTRPIFLCSVCLSAHSPAFFLVKKRGAYRCLVPDLIPVLLQWGKTYSCYGSRSALTSPLDSILYLMRTAHARLIPIRHDSQSDGDVRVCLSYDSAW